MGKIEMKNKKQTIQDSVTIFLIINL